MGHLSAFESIPIEILDQILDYLDQWTVPERNLRAQPSPEIFAVPNKRKLTLKSLSLVSKSLCQITRPRLFRHVRIIRSASQSTASEPQVEPFSWINVLSDLAGFLDQYGLGSCVQSFTLRVEDESSDTHYREYPGFLEGQGILDIEEQWQNLLQVVSVSLQRLIILAPPCTLGILLSIKLSPYVGQVLHMPYHLVALERPKPTIQARIITGSNGASTIQKLTDLGWTSLLLNEGSFLRYHTENSRHWEGILLSTLEAGGELCWPSSLCQTIQSIEYIAAFPPYDQIVAWISSLEAMRSLKELSFQTLPIRDLDPDPLQRYVVHILDLERNRFNVYFAIIAHLIRAPASERLRAHGTPFQQLRILQCTDPDEKGFPLTWRRIGNDIEEYGWTWGEPEEVTGEAGAYAYRDRMIRKRTARSSSLPSTSYSKINLE